jgi:hypothetical protein
MGRFDGKRLEGDTEKDKGEKMDKADAVLAEYKALRDELLNNFSLQLQVYSIYSSGLLVLSSLARGNY